MYVFGNDKKSRGCFHAWNEFKITNGVVLTMPSSGDIPASDQDPIFVVSVKFNLREKVSVVQCFNDTNYVYAFGHDPRGSMVSVQMLAFLIASDGTSDSDIVGTMVSNYAQDRLSQSLQQATLSIGSQSLNGFVTDLASSTGNQEYNIQYFTANMLLTEPQE